MRWHWTRPRQESPVDIGTLWTLCRDLLKARCALLASPDAWEVRVLIDGQIVTSARFDVIEEAFAAGERWKLELLAQSWQQVVPRTGRSTKIH